MERSILSPNVRIDNYSEVIDSILMAGVRIGKNVKIRKAIIDKSVIVPDGKHIGHNLEADAKQFVISEKVLL